MYTMDMGIFCQMLLTSDFSFLPKVALVK